jgi:formylglycine-generating enzyme required for sulfatase activity
VSAELGSRASEVAEAMQLCLEHGGACTPDDFAGEELRHVQLARGRLDATEVTFAEFEAWADAQAKPTRAERAGASFDGPLRVAGLSFRRPLRPGDAGPGPVPPDDAVVHVSIEEARAFCEARGARLPDADEWEHAARGAERRIFPWGDDWDLRRLDSALDGSTGPGRVGRFPRGATPEGLLDLAGNVWEWTSTRTEDGYVIKGGSWDDDVPTYFRAAAIAVVEPDYTSSDLGFRCFTPTPSPATADDAVAPTEPFSGE